MIDNVLESDLPSEIKVSAKTKLLKRLEKMLLWYGVKSLILRNYNDLNEITTILRKDFNKKITSYSLRLFGSLIKHFSLSRNIIKFTFEHRKSISKLFTRKYSTLQAKYEKYLEYDAINE